MRGQEVILLNFPISHFLKSLAHSALTILDLALAVGLADVDESSDGQGNKKANDADHNIKSDCHEPCALK